MPFGVNDDAITTNDTVTAFMPQLSQMVQAEDVFAQFFKDMPKPANSGRTVNFVIESDADEAIRRAPGTPAVSNKRSQYEVEVNILDKFRHSHQITREKMLEGRFNEAEASVRSVARAMARARTNYYGSFLLTNPSTGGTPVDPAAVANGQTAYWWNSNDTIAPPTYGKVAFSVGHDHVETGGASAITLDRLQDDIVEEIVEHGKGRQGILVAINLQEERTLTKLANEVQQNVRLSEDARRNFQYSKVGTASGLQGLNGLSFVSTQWVDPGIIAAWDVNLPTLGDNGGAVRVTEIPLEGENWVDKNTQSVWIDSSEMFGAGILAKDAGVTLHVA